MIESEYRGSKLGLIYEEIRRFGSPYRFAYRLAQEISRAGGLHRRRFPSREIKEEALYESLSVPVSSKPALLAYFRSRQSPRHPFPPEKKDEIRHLLKSHFAEECEKTCTAAEAICSHRYTFFGREVRFENQIDWHAVCERPGSWPRRHWSEIDIRGGPSLGDVKYNWELNRHQHLLTLGRAYFYTQDERYAQACVDELTSWIHQNPCEIGVNWLSNLEVAIRSISWIWAFRYFVNSPRFTPEACFLVIRTLFTAARHLLKHIHYSEVCMPNNHWLGDSTGLALLGLNFPEFHEAAEWQRTGLEVLWSQIDVQNLDDGTNFEQAISYHRFVLYFYLLVALDCFNNHVLVPPCVWRKIEKMVEVIAYLRKPTGLMTQIGDWDDARAIVLTTDPVTDFSSTLAVAAALFCRPDFKFLAGRISQEVLWLLGPEGVQRFDELPVSEPKPLSRSFPVGGYYAMRSSWKPTASYSLLKCSPHADHGHADQLHLELSCEGYDWLVDSGTYTYNGDWSWRVFFRDTHAHNTVVIDHESQSLSHRTFRWVKVAKHQVLRWESNEQFDYVAGEQLGYQRLRFPATHRREVLFLKPHTWIIVDTITGSGEHCLELLFHFVPCHVAILEKAFIARQGDRATMAILPGLPDGLEMSVVCGSLEPKQGWYSPQYGVKEPAPTALFRRRTVIPARFVTLLTPIDKLTILPLFRCGETAVVDRASEFTAQIERESDIITVRFKEGTLPTIGREPKGARQPVTPDWA